MNQKLFAACSRLSDEDRKLDRQAFFGSIHGTLNHIMYGDRAWMNRLAERSYESGRARDILFDDFEDLKEARVALDRDIICWVNELQEDWLFHELTWASMIDGTTRTQPRWMLLSHMFNHGTHHRGQVTTLLYQAGIDIGTTDLPWMPAIGFQGDTMGITISPEAE